MTTTYTVLIEGQTIPVPEEIGADDAKVKKMLAPFYPDAANAMITRTTKDDAVTINVIKKAGTKGATSMPPLAALLDCPGGQNPAVALYLELTNSFSPANQAAVLEMEPRLVEAVTLGQEQGKRLVYAYKRLAAARPQPAPLVPLGF